MGYQVSNHLVEAIGPVHESKADAVEWLREYLGEEPLVGYAIHEVDREVTA